MIPFEDRPDVAPAAGREFATTHWSVVLSAGRKDSVHAQESMAKLCQSYWYPLYAYVRRWALTLLERVLQTLRDEFTSQGKAGMFGELKATLTAGRGAVPYREMAARLGMTEGAVKVAAHRLRQRYRDVLRAEIANTVATPAEVEEEIRHLFAALR
jgi:hypothetical protein